MDDIKRDDHQADAAQTEPIKVIAPAEGETGKIPVNPFADGASGTAAGDAPLDATDAEVYARLKQRRAERRKKKVRTRAIVAGVIAAVLIIAVVAVHLLTASEPEQDSEPVTDIAMQGTYTTQVDAEGTLEPLSSTVVTPEVDGTIAEIKVAAGQTVKKGDVLFTIKNDELDQAVDKAYRELQSAKKAQSQGYQDYNNQVDEYNADDTGEVAAPDESSLTDLDSAVESAQETYNQAVAEAEKRTVTAPSAGSIIALNAQVGAAVGADYNDSSSPLVQIADISQMKVRVQVGEESIAKVAEKQGATVTFSAFDDLSLDGTVTGIASTATGEGDSSYYDGDGSGVTFAVDVLIPKPDSRLKPGMTAQVSLIIEQMDNVVMVPISTLMTDDGESYYVNVEIDEETHTYESRPVTVYAQNDDYAVIGRPAEDADDAAVDGDINDPDAAATGDAASDASANADMEIAPVSDGDVLIISGGTPSDESEDGAVELEGSSEDVTVEDEGSDESTDGSAGAEVVE